MTTPLPSYPRPSFGWHGICSPLQTACQATDGTAFAAPCNPRANSSLGTHFAPRASSARANAVPTVRLARILLSRAFRACNIRANRAASCHFLDRHNPFVSKGLGLPPVLTYYYAKGNRHNPFVSIGLWPIHLTPPEHQPLGTLTDPEHPQPVRVPFGLAPFVRVLLAPAGGSGPEQNPNRGVRFHRIWPPRCGKSREK